MKLFWTSLFTLAVISSFVFGLVMLLLIYTDSVNLTLAVSLTVGINFILWLIGPFFTQLINEWLYKAKFYKKEEFTQIHPEAAKLIDDISTKYNFPFPKVGIIPDQNPTAYSFGSGRFNSRIVLTEGIFHFLSSGEVNSVVAHEMGHIVNRDFIVMMVASTMVQILYEIYAVLIRAKGKRSGNSKIIALVAYALYLVSVYLLYFLSRTREYLADEFSAKVTSPQDLANSLIKIAYGIVTVPDSENAKHLLHSTRHLGIIDVKNAKHIGAAAYITNSNPNALAEVMVFDRISPWAKIIELNSTHPLTGNRLDALSDLSKKYGKYFAWDIDGAIARLNIDKEKLYGNFFVGLAVYFAPVVLVLFSLVFFLSWKIVLLAIGIGTLIQAIYRFPMGEDKSTTILEQMRDPYASPVRGKPILLSGKVIGRGEAGYIFSEDMMYQDNTGLTFLDYHSFFGFIGDFFFALGKIKTLFGIPSKARGWYFRTMGSYVALKSVQTDQETVSSHPVLWSIVIPAILILVSSFALLR